MRVALAVGLAASLVLLAVPTSAGTATFDPEVNIEFSAYRPSQLDVLPGETVSWTNVSQRTHTVTSDTGLFDSGDVVGGAHFSHRFDSVGTFAYHCTIHPGITGEIDVRRVTLDRLPPGAVPVGKAVEFSGRTADPTEPVAIQRLNGSAWTTVATAAPFTDGTWKTDVKADSPGDYRAASGPDVSETRRLLVSVWKVGLRRTRTGVDVTVTPSVPYARFLVELHLRERFGWWPAASGKLDYVSSAEVRIKQRPAKVRVVLVDKDGWTPLATSRTVILR
jgi:plastocyanin